MILEAAAQVLGDGEVEAERAVGHGEAGGRLGRAQHPTHDAGWWWCCMMVVPWTGSSVAPPAHGGESVRGRRHVEI